MGFTVHSARLDEALGVLLQLFGQRHMIDLPIGKKGIEPRFGRFDMRLHFGIYLPLFPSVQFQSAGIVRAGGLTSKEQQEQQEGK